MRRLFPLKVVMFLPAIDGSSVGRFFDTWFWFRNAWLLICSFQQRPLGVHLDPFSPSILFWESET